MARLTDGLRDEAGGRQKAVANLLALLNPPEQKSRLPHAMAFVGPPGAGQQEAAWAVAQTLICAEANAFSSVCGECPACRRVALRQSESVLCVEPDGPALKLESAHLIQQFLTLRLLGRARVVIISDAQVLNPQASNALLKVIEEPPPETYFILLVNDLTQILPTLRSRLQVFRFSPQAQRGSQELNDDSQELRALALDFVVSSLEGRRAGLDALLDRGKERAAASAILQFLQQILRDWSVLDEAPPLHADLAARLRQLPARPPHARVELWRATFQMERDLNGNIDRSLIWQTFYYRLKGANGLD